MLIMMTKMVETYNKNLFFDCLYCHIFILQTVPLVCVCVCVCVYIFFQLDHIPTHSTFLDGRNYRNCSLHHADS